MIRVAAAAIKNEKGEILLAKRPPHKHKGDLWEFPGGKIEQNETDEQALVRELQEELNITATRWQPLIRLQHHYPEKSVELVVFTVTEFSGELHPNEGQPLTWVLPNEIHQFPMPEADVPIVNALQLPPFMAITPQLRDDEDFYRHCVSVLSQTDCFLHLRDPELNDHVFRRIVEKLLTHVAEHHRLIVNRHWPLIADLPIGGFHFSATQLRALSPNVRQQIPKGKWLSASCHDENELKLAEQWQLDYCFLSPVQKTSSHPNVSPLGWPTFSETIIKTALPVYALGGLTRDDYSVALQHGAQGVAGIRNFW